MKINFIKIYEKYKRLIKYSLFGILTAVVNFAVKYILLFLILDPTNWLELQIAVVLSWIAAVLFAYFTNRKYVFESTRTDKFKEFISFIVGRLTTLLLEMFIMWFFVTFLKLNSDLYVVIFTIIAQIVVIIGNYLFSKLFVFKKNKEGKNERKS